MKILPVLRFLKIPWEWRLVVDSVWSEHLESTSRGEISGEGVAGGTTGEGARPQASWLGGLASQGRLAPVWSHFLPKF